MGDQPAAGSENRSVRDRFMAVGVFVLLVASFRPWFASQASSGTASKTAWTGSPQWCAAVLFGVVATLVWFGAFTGLSERSRRLVAAGLLLAALGGLAQQWWDMHTEVLVIYERHLTVTDVHEEVPDRLPEEPRRPRWEPLYIRHDEGISADIRVGHHVAAATLLAMFVVAAAAAAASLRPAGGRPRAEA